jgi:hypothetical protein
VAISLLTSLAEEARSYRDETLRARVQAHVADLLWEEDREQARPLFHRAWDAAEAIEGTFVGVIEPLMPGRFSKRPGPRPRMNLRLEIVRLAARRDRALGEEFLARLTNAKRAEAERAGGARQPQPEPELSQQAIIARLMLAGEFLEADDTERALQLADPALGQASYRTIQFLVNLREKSPAAADQRFAALLARAGTDPSADANTVSLLASYAFTPSTYLTVSETGIPSSINNAPRPAPNLAPNLRAAFFHLAARLLLRPSAQLDRTSAGRAGTYYIAARLLPLFQQHAPDLVAAVSAQLAALRPDAPPSLAAGNDRSLGRGIQPESAPADRLQEELADSLGAARNADQRDRAYAFAAMRASDVGDPRAYEFLDKLEDLETRNGIRRFVDYNFIGGLLKKKEADEAVRRARKSELLPIQRIWILSRAAALLAKTDRQRALEWLDEALTETQRINAASDRAYALVAILARFSKIDRARAWELIGEMVKAANAVADFTGENSQTSMQLEGKFKIQLGIQVASPTDLPEAFATLAEDDLYRAIEHARNFNGEAPRALAILAVARSVLEKKRDAPTR